ncbi:TniB family NTP-binding protein [uncultured Alteromonas sp.]|uniref:TniB family NTP-binding protein n=1 Tax=uncultured Alteromonas sp. TaxID=179113 RepID=UPI0030DDC448
MSKMFDHPSLNRCAALLERVHHKRFDANYSLLITGLSGTGKSYFASSYLSHYPSINTPQLTIRPVVYVKLTETRTAVDLLLQIVKAFTNVVGNNVNKAHIVQDRLSVLLREHKVELIIIDEVQECLTDIDGITSQRMAKQIAALLDNNPDISLLMLGTPVAGRLLRLRYGKSTERLKGEEQLSRRFMAEQKLNIIPSRCQCWLACCNYFSEKYKFSSFSLEDKQLLNRLHIATDGRIGLLNKLFSVAQIIEQPYFHKKLEEAYLASINSSAFNPFNTDMLSDDDVIALLDSREFQ